MSSSNCRLCLGTMTFSADAGNGQVKKEAVKAILKKLAASERAKVPELGGKVLVDTARIYQCGTPDADTETVLGEIFAEDPELKKACNVATKCVAPMSSHKTLCKQGVIEQCETSLKKLGIDQIDLYYLHAPDVKTDIGDTLEAIDELHKAGKIKEFGLSNYPAWKMVDIYHRCKAKGTVLPTVCQLMYNGICRDLEREVVPVLREFGMRAMNYNPLAGGLLTGRYAKREDLMNADTGRFSLEFGKSFGGTLPANKMYQERFGKEAFFEALVEIKKACDAEKIGMVPAAIRWTLHHSYLSAKHGDGIIFGVSSVEQMEANLAACAEGPLPKSIVDSIDLAWGISKPACECYFRGYGPKPGDVTAHLEMFGQKPGEVGAAVA